MLFLADLLKFQTVFGKLWLAGTIGAKKRPFNKEIVSTFSVEVFVDSVFNSETPLAPRLCGTLLCGICNIYNQKSFFLHSDVNILFKELCNDFDSRKALCSYSKKERTRKIKEQDATKKITQRKSVAIEEMLENLDQDTLDYIPDTLEEQNEYALTNLLHTQTNQNLEHSDSTLSFFDESNPLSSTSEYEIQMDPILLFEENLQHIGNFELIDSYQINDEEVDMMQDENSIDHNEEEEKEEENDESQENQMDKQKKTLDYNGAENDDENEKSNTNSIELLEIDKTPDPISHEDKHISSDQNTKIKRKQKYRARINPLLLDKNTTLPDAIFLKRHEDSVSNNVNVLGLTGGNTVYNKTKFVFEYSSRLYNLIECIENNMTAKFQNNSHSNLCVTYNSEAIVTNSNIIGSNAPSLPNRYAGQNAYEYIIAEDQSDKGLKDIERLRGIFDINDDERYNNTALRYQMRRDTVLRYSTNTLDENASQFSVYSSIQKRNTYGRISHEVDFQRSSLFDDRRSISSLCLQHPKPLQVVRAGTPIHPSLLPSGTSIDKDTLASLPASYNSAGQIERAYTIETWKFRTFIESHFKEYQETDQLSFFDIVPIGKVDSFIAARSFYNLLILANSGDFDIYLNVETQEIFISNNCSVSSKSYQKENYSSFKPVYDLGENQLASPESSELLLQC